MRRRRLWARRIGRGVGTVAIGALLGFVIPTIAHDLTPEPEVQSAVAEAPLARQFINAFVADDQTVLASLGVTSDVQLRAARFRADFARVDAPIHLGSYVGGGYTVHAYGIHVVRQDGTEDTLSWRVVTSGGRVGVLTPPGQVERE